MFLITDKPIDVCSLIESATKPENGASATFIGTVRNHTRGVPVREMFYECYPAMALRSFENIAWQCRNQWKVSELIIVHRTGTLKPGEIAVFILAASEHRKDALEACAFAIERIKQVSPIWKKELSPGHALL